MVDLTSEDYSIVREVSSANDLFNPQKHIMNGVNPSKITNISSNYYIQSDEYSCMDLWIMNAMFRTFCELDLEEVKRVKNFENILSLTG